MEFIDILTCGNFIDCDLIVGGYEMPASFVWNEDSTVSQYCKEVFGELLNSEAICLENGNIKVMCDDKKLGERFVWSAAGYISSSEYDKLFQCNPKETLLQLIKSIDENVNDIEIITLDNPRIIVDKRMYLLLISITESQSLHGYINIYLDRDCNLWRSDSSDFAHGLQVKIQDDELIYFVYGEFIGLLRREYQQIKDNIQSLFKEAQLVGTVENIIGVKNYMETI